MSIATPIKFSNKSMPFFQDVAQKNIENIEGKTVIKNVVIIQSGYDKVGDFFTKEFINAIVKDGNAQPQGVKSRFGHPQMCKTTLGSYIGRYKNFRVITDESDGLTKAIADLHLAEISKSTNVEGRDISMHDYILNLVKEDSAAFGNSIVYSYDFRERKEDDELPEDYTEPMVQELKSLIASDIVDSPAATTDIFKGVDDLGVQISSFMSELSDEQSNQLINVLETNPDIIKGFLAKFKELKKSNMKKSNIFQSVKDALFLKETASKDFTITTADGTILTVVTEDDRTEPIVGDTIVDADGNAAPDGDVLMPDGSTLVMAGGVVAEIKPMEETTETISERAVGEELKEFKKDTQKSIDAMQKTLKAVTDELSEVTKSVQFIAKNMKSSLEIQKAIKPNKDREDDEPAVRTITKK